MSGQAADPATLIRFVVGPESTIYPDLAGKLPGRGIWLTANRATVQTALKKRAFARAAKQPVTVSAEMPDLLESLLVRQCLDLLGLARRASQAVAGFEKVKQWLGAGRVGVLLQAADGAADGRRKLANLAGDVPLVTLFSGAELSLALGRGNVIHAALAPGRLAERFLAEVARLRGFRSSNEERAGSFGGHES